MTRGATGGGDRAPGCRATWRRCTRRVGVRSVRRWPNAATRSGVGVPRVAHDRRCALLRAVPPSRRERLARRRGGVDGLAPACARRARRRRDRRDGRGLARLRAKRRRRRGAGCVHRRLRNERAPRRRLRRQPHHGVAGRPVAPLLLERLPVPVLPAVRREHPPEARDGPRGSGRPGRRLPRVPAVRCGLGDGRPPLEVRLADGRGGRPERVGTLARPRLRPAGRGERRVGLAVEPLRLHEGGRRRRRRRPAGLYGRAPRRRDGGRRGGRRDRRGRSRAPAGDADVRARELRHRQVAADPGRQPYETFRKAIRRLQGT